MTVAALAAQEVVVLIARIPTARHAAAPLTPHRVRPTRPTGRGLAGAVSVVEQWGR